LKKPSAFKMLTQFAGKVLLWMLSALYLLLFINEFVGFLGSKPLSYLFGGTVWVVHGIVLCLMGYFGREALRKVRIGSPQKSPA
jgi:hypothetical protein